jgi:PAB-dependent poly(A)-specific ribonuclease subunit 2
VLIVADFDFSYYNHTEHGGLETHIRNSYLNALLQVLYFTWPLRELAKTHIRQACLREPCLACEAGFLFRMLECCQGVNCQASNFLRAFDLIPQGFFCCFQLTVVASALGLLEAVSDQGALRVGSLIQTCCRFILEQLHSEITDNQLFDAVVGIPYRSTSKCDMGLLYYKLLTTADHEQVRETYPFVIDLSYPTVVARKKKTLNFVDILASSVNKEQTTKAWCPVCNEYKLTKTSNMPIR